MSSHPLTAAVWIAAALMLLTALVVALVRRVSRRTPGLHLGWPLAAAVGVRLSSVILVAVVPAFGRLPGPDEKGYIRRAWHLLHDIHAEGAMPRALTHDLQIWMFAAEFKVIGPHAGTFPVRVTQIAISVVAIAIVAIAVAELAGPKAALVAAWITALEPGGVFYSGLLLKEPVVLLGEALVVLGCVRMYTRRNPAAAGFMVVGLVPVALVRPHVAIALGVACLVTTLHAAARHPGWTGRAVALVAVGGIAAAGIALAVPRLDRIRSNIQASQHANATDNSHLKLEPVDFSTWSGTARAVPQRTFEFLVRPYPWQVANMNQRFGVAGTLTCWALLLSTLVLALARPRSALRRLPPLAYVAVFMTLGYAVITGNAGSGFRYRVHVLVVLAACVGVLSARERRRQRAGPPPGQPARPAEREASEASRR
jgi:hypothetical protein